MDLHLKHWNHHHHQQQQQQDDESEEQQPSAKFPKLHPQLPPPIPNHNFNNYSDNINNSKKDHSTLPLFVPDHPDPHQPTNSSSSSISSSPRMGSYFSLAQWQELELQALIYRYMLSGATIPPELLHPIKNTLPHPHPHHSYFLHLPQSQLFRFQSGYWGRMSMDPEPGRCRRTDGKKWRCSRDVVLGQKYCERHVHRGRNRSRKPVEISPTPGTSAAAATATNTSRGIVHSGYLKSSTDSVTRGSCHLAISGSSHPPIDLFQMNKSDSSSHSGPIPDFGNRTDPCDGHVLRHFFDDWPRTLQEPDIGSLTGLSMSIAGNPSSDISLKLSTGDGGSDRTPGSNWLMGLSPSRVASVGGPLAEALRSTTMTMEHTSPTSVLHRLPYGVSAGETGLVTQL